MFIGDLYLISYKMVNSNGNKHLLLLVNHHWPQSKAAHLNVTDDFFDLYCLNHQIVFNHQTNHNITTNSTNVFYSGELFTEASVESIAFSTCCSQETHFKGEDVSLGLPKQHLL